MLASFKNELIPRTNVPYSYICSWAVFGDVQRPVKGFTDTSNVRFPQTRSRALPSSLRSDVVLLGLNPGSAAMNGRDDWTAFHAGGKHHDERLAEACRTTQLWGSLMTDLFPLIIDSKSEDVQSVLSGKKQAPAGENAMYDLAANVAAFDRSLSLAGVAQDGNVTLICVGTAVETWARRLLLGTRNTDRLSTTKRSYELVGTQHYSNSNRKFNDIPPSERARHYAQWVEDDLRKGAPSLLLDQEAGR